LPMRQSRSAAKATNRKDPRSSCSLDESRTQEIHDLAVPQIPGLDEPRPQLSAPAHHEYRDEDRDERSGGHFILLMGTRHLGMASPTASARRESSETGNPMGASLLPSSSLAFVARGCGTDHWDNSPLRITRTR
jgi:hypothetical protein